MSSYIPEWVFNLSCGMIASEFLTKNLTLHVISKKYSESISKEYNLVDPESFEEVAEQFLLLLNELEVGPQSIDFLNGYCCYKLNFVNPKTRRNLKGIFNKELKGTSSIEYSKPKALKTFKAYIFSQRSGQMEFAPAGWTIDKDITIDFLNAIPGTEIGIEKLFD